MTFKQYMENVDMQVRNRIFAAIVEEARVSLSAIYAWEKGTRTPTYTTQVVIRNTILRITGEDFTTEELFPCS